MQRPIHWHNSYIYGTFSATYTFIKARKYKPNDLKGPDSRIDTRSDRSDPSGQYRSANPDYHLERRRCCFSAARNGPLGSAADGPAVPQHQVRGGFGRGKANNTNISGSVLRFRALHSVLLVRPTSLPLHSTRCCRRASTRNPGALTEAGMPIAHLSCAMTCMILYINVFVFWAAVIRYQRRVPPGAPSI